MPTCSNSPGAKIAPRLPHATFPIRVFPPALLRVSPCNQERVGLMLSHQPQRTLQNHLSRRLKASHRKRLHLSGFFSPDRALYLNLRTHLGRLPLRRLWGSWRRWRWRWWRWLGQPWRWWWRWRKARLLAFKSTGCRVVLTRLVSLTSKRGKTGIHSRDRLRPI